VSLLSFTSKMRFSIAAAALFASVASVCATDHTVIVGGNGTLTFNPSSIQAANGDAVIFQFQAKNHSVTQTTFANPCAGMAGGVDSGFQATANGTTQFAEWKITINNASAPLWFYCAQTNPKDHCQAGMVFAVNANAAKSFDAYLKNAQAFTGAAAPGTTAAGATTTAGAPGTTNTAATVGNTAPPSGGAPSSGGAPPAGGAASTSIGTIPTNSIPAPNTGLSGAAVTGSAEAANAQVTSPSSAMRLGGSLSAVLISVFISSLIL
jgi:plastocyanin